MPSFRSLPRAVAGAPRRPRDSRIVPLLLVAAAAFAAPCVGAAEPSLSLAEALKIAVTRSQQLVSQRAMAEAAREMVVPAGELPDPKLKVGVENVPTDGADAWSLDARLHDDVEDRPDAGIPGRGEAPATGSSAPNVTPNAARPRSSPPRSRLSAKPPPRGSRAASRRKPSARSRHRSAKPSSMRRPSPRRIGPTRRRRASSSPRRAWWSSSGNRATEAAAQAKRARIMLARYIGPAAERPLGDAPDFSRLPDAVRLADVDAQPELRLARAQESVAAAEAALAGAAKRPDWSAEVSYAVRGSPYSNMVSLMFSIDLPWSAGTRQDRDARGQVAGARCGARDARGCAADAQRGS